jgi:hypothetical protein
MVLALVSMTHSITTFPTEFIAVIGEFSYEKPNNLRVAPGGRVQVDRALR